MLQLSLLAKPSSSETQTVLGHLRWGNALILGDLNLDKKIDIVVRNVEAPTTIYFNDGSGRDLTTVHFGDSRGAVFGFAITDFDHDCFADVAVARSDAPNMIYLGSAGTRTKGNQ